MSKQEFDPQELSLEEIEEMLATADFDDVDEDSVADNDGDAATANEEVSGYDASAQDEPSGQETQPAKQAEVEEQNEETNADEDLFNGVKIEVVEEGSKEPEQAKETEEQTLTDEEMDDILTKLLEDPKATIEQLVEQKLQEKLEEQRRLQEEQIRMQQEIEQKWNTFVEQADKLADKVPDFNQVVTDELLGKLAQDEKAAQLVYNADNIAEAVYFYGKFGTVTPSIDQIAEIFGSNGTEQQTKEVPKPIKGKAVGGSGADNIVPETLDIADLDF